MNETDAPLPRTRHRLRRLAAGTTAVLAGAAAVTVPAVASRAQTTGATDPPRAVRTATATRQDLVRTVTFTGRLTSSTSSTLTNQRASGGDPGVVVQTSPANDTTETAANVSPGEAVVLPGAWRAQVDDTTTTTEPATSTTEPSTTTTTEPPTTVTTEPPTTTTTEPPTTTTTEPPTTTTTEPPPSGTTTTTAPSTPTTTTPATTTPECPEAPPPTDATTTTTTGSSEDTTTTTTTTPPATDDSGCPPESTTPDTTVPGATPPGGPPGGGGPGAAPVAASAAAPTTDGTGDGQGGGGGDQTVTWIASVGDPLQQGDVAYGVDGTVTVALYGDVPAWRDLSTDSDDGADILQLEQALVALGYATAEQLTVDQHFDADTEAAVEAFEAAYSFEPDGVIALGDVQFLSGPATVTAAAVQLGDAVGQGTDMLTVADAARAITVHVDPADSELLALDTDVEAEIGNTIVAGTVSAIGRDATAASDDSTPTVEISIELSDPSAVADVPDGAEATITVTEEARNGALTVPAGTLHDGPDAGFAVTVLNADGSQTIVSVTPGFDAGGAVEVTRGDLVEGAQVVIG